MAKIAVKIGPQAGQRAMSNGAPPRRILSRGNGWTVADVVCRAGPHDPSFEEQHQDVGIAIVVQGTFQYGSALGVDLMTPGSLLLGNAGQYFECGHDHAAGDRCISFTYSPEYFEALAETNGKAGPLRFSIPRIPPVRDLAKLISRACAGLIQATRPDGVSPDSDGWEEMAVELAGRALHLGGCADSKRSSQPSGEARVTRVVRRIDSHPEWDHGLASLANEAKLSRYHFLRLFQGLTGLSPHQFVLRTRLRNAATRLIVDREPILDVALDSGFDDVSNFNHAFRAEFGMSPRSYRRMYGRLAA